MHQSFAFKSEIYLQFITNCWLFFLNILKFYRKISSYISKFCLYISKLLLSISKFSSTSWINKSWMKNQERKDKTLVSIPVLASTSYLKKENQTCCFIRFKLLLMCLTVYRDSHWAEGERCWRDGDCSYTWPGSRTTRLWREKQHDQLKQKNKTTF